MKLYQIEYNLLPQQIFYMRNDIKCVLFPIFAFETI